MCEKEERRERLFVKKTCERGERKQERDKGMFFIFLRYKDKHFFDVGKTQVHFFKNNAISLASVALSTF